MAIVFPDSFPTIDQMKTVIQKTVEKSWKNDLSVTDIDKWLSNFTGEVLGDSEDEKRLAMWMLCNVSFFSNDEMKHQCKMLFNQFIHRFLIDNNANVSDIPELLNNVYFSSIGSASESGGLILYLFRQEAGLPLDHFFYPTVDDENIFNTNNTLVFVDDAILSGGTASRNFHIHIKPRIDKIKKIYYLSIFASQEGISKLKDINSKISVLYCNYVDERDKAFNNSSLMFYQFRNLIEPAQLMAQKYGERLVVGTKNGPLGYKNGQYFFCFFYNTPNNVLPIMWSENNWVPLFRRKEKYQNAKHIVFKSGKFI